MECFARVFPISLSFCVSKLVDGWWWYFVIFYGLVYTVHIQGIIYIYRGRDRHAMQAQGLALTIYKP